MNKELWKHMKQPRIELQIRKWKWKWLGHTMRKTTDNTARQTGQGETEEHMEKNGA
jgi:hypothetical protein